MIIINLIITIIVMIIIVTIKGEYYKMETIFMNTEIVRQMNRIYLN